MNFVALAGLALSVIVAVISCTAYLTNRFGDLKNTVTRLETLLTGANGANGIKGEVAEARTDIRELRADITELKIHDAQKY